MTAMAGPIPVEAFYRSARSQSEPVAAQLERRAGCSRLGAVCARPRPSLLGPSVRWQVFRRQADALRAAAASPGLRLLTFGCEERAPGGGGRRVFLLCHPSVFWRCDLQKRPEDRCSYEVIRHGAPCRLYLDLEFDRSRNLGRDGDAMVELFVKVMLTVVQHLFKIKCTRRDVIDLCASSDKKLSRHIILCCKGLVFKDNTHVGNLVKEVCWAIRKLLYHEMSDDLVRLGLQEFSREEFSALMVNCKDENRFFCDEGVYTKNRNFRVYGSRKFGSSRPLVKSVHNEYIPRDQSGKQKSDDPTDEAFFLDSLVSFVEVSGEPLTYGRSDEDAPPPPAASVTRRELGSEGGGLTASPYPEIDEFVRGQVTPGGVRRWSYFPDSECVVYDIVGYRFCQNVGRWHRSNNIIIVVNVREASFYQKCHDPACQGFRSDELPLPATLVPWQYLDDWSDDGPTAEPTAAFPDCGASDCEMAAAAAALAEPAGPAPAGAACPMPDCGVPDWQLQEAGDCGPAPPAAATSCVAADQLAQGGVGSDVWDDLPDDAFLGCRL